MAKGGNGGGPSKNDSSYVKGTGSGDLLTDEGLVRATLAGGRGDDTYLVFNSDTAVLESAGEGVDTVETALSWILGAWLEKLRLTGTDDVSGAGNHLDNVLVGNLGANELLGLEGADLLDGRGGDDTLRGGVGEDTLIGGPGSDLLDGGADTDVAAFDGLASEYEITRDGDDVLVVGASGSDRLTSIETLRFADRDIAADQVVAGPVAVEDSAAGVEDSAIRIDVLANDLGQGITVTSTGDGARGLVSDNGDGTLTYRPNADANGFDSFTYTIQDANGLTSSTEVMLTIRAVNDAPVALDDSFSTAQGMTLSGAVLGNDADPDGDALTIVTYDEVSSAGGTVQMSGDGMFAYSPLAGFTGSDNFSYTISDGNGGESTGTVHLSVGPESGLDAPPHYVSGLIHPDDSVRINWPDPVGTAVTVTYGFLTEVPSYYDWWTLDKSTFDAFTEQQKQATREALAAIEEFAGIDFIEVAPADAGMTFGTVACGSEWGFAYKPFGGGVGSYHSDVWLDATYAGDEFAPGTEAFGTLIHEIGHALGLRHPDLPTTEDNAQYTVMAAAPHPGIAEPVEGFALFDVAALQHLYGGNTAHATGDDVYDASMLVDRNTLIWDAGGRDTIDLSDAPHAVHIDLSEGSFSTAHASGQDNISIAYGTMIEGAIGSAGSDNLAGNAADNVIDGNVGDDTMEGRDGSDTFMFGANWGNDTIVDFESGSDLIDLRATGISFAELKVTHTDGNSTIAHGDNSITVLGQDFIGENDVLA